MRSFIFSLALVATVSGTMISAVAATADKNTDNENAAQTIADNLKQSGKLKDFRVGVKYEDGVAWLMGTVTSEQQKQIAEQLARESTGVSHVVSKLEVENPAVTPVEDKQVQVASTAGVRQQRRQQAPRRSARNKRGNNMPLPYARTRAGMPQGPRQGPPQGRPQGPPQGRGVQPANFRQAQYSGGGGGAPPMGMGPQGAGGAVGAAASYDNPQMPGYAWPSYAASPNYSALTYPKQYSPSAWPYIGPFYPYPQVPLGWRKVTMEWDDGWWFLDFADGNR